MCSQFPHSNLVAALTKVYWRRAEIVCSLCAKALHSHNSVKRASLAESLGHVHARARVRFSLLDPSTDRSLTRAPLTRSHASRRALARASLAPSLARSRTSRSFTRATSRSLLRGRLARSRTSRPLARTSVARARQCSFARDRGRIALARSFVRRSVARFSPAHSLARSRTVRSLAIRSLSLCLLAR